MTSGLEMVRQSLQTQAAVYRDMEGHWQQMAGRRVSERPKIDESHLASEFVRRLEGDLGRGFSEVKADDDVYSAPHPIFLQLKHAPHSPLPPIPAHTAPPPSLT